MAIFNSYVKLPEGICIKNRSGFQCALLATPRAPREVHCWGVNDRGAQPGQEKMSGYLEDHPTNRKQVGKWDIQYIYTVSIYIYTYTHTHIYI